MKNPLAVMLLAAAIMAVLLGVWHKAPAQEYTVTELNHEKGITRIVQFWKKDEGWFTRSTYIYHVFDDRPGVKLKYDWWLTRGRENPK